MATSLSNFLPFLSPSKPPAPSPPSQPPKTLPFLSLSTHKSGNSFASLAATKSEHNQRHISSKLSSVMNPALAHANTLFFSGYNVQVIVDDNEPEERLLNRFRREVMRAGVIQECKRRRFFENKQDKEKRKTREAAKRNRRRRPQSRFPAQNKQETSTTKKNDDDDEDNWDLPEDLPF